MLTVEYISKDESWLDGDQVAVPLEMTLSENTLTVEYYPSAKTLVDEFMRLFGEDEAALFSRNAISWAADKLGSFLEKYGFELSPDSYDYYVNYALPATDEKTLDAVRRLDGTESYEDLTDTDIDALIASGYIIYAAVCDNKIVAVANTGVPIDEGTTREVEIGVDTAMQYRRNGYGKACVCALVRELESLGHTAIYECASGNTASIKLAESLGGVVVYKKYYIVGFAD